MTSKPLPEFVDRLLREHPVFLSHERALRFLRAVLRECDLKPGIGMNAEECKRGYVLLRWADADEWEP